MHHQQIKDYRNCNTITSLLSKNKLLELPNLRPGGSSVYYLGTKTNCKKGWYKHHFISELGDGRGPCKGPVDPSILRGGTRKMVGKSSDITRDLSWSRDAKVCIEEIWERSIRMWERSVRMNGSNLEFCDNCRNANTEA